MTTFPEESLPEAPIFLLADDDRSALDRILSVLDSHWCYIPVWEARRVVPYARKLQITAIFLADDLRYPRGGTARLLQDLLDKVGRPVIVLVESWTPEAAARWKRMGATDCIPHPTRFERRLQTLREKCVELAVRHVSERKTP